MATTLKPLNQISNLQEIEQQRVILLKQVYKHEKQVRRDADHIADSWRRWTSIGSAVSNLATMFLPKLNILSITWEWLGKLFRKKKK